MAQTNEMVNRLAFVGNLPPDATQEEMKQLCSQVGEVILFRIVYDRETGKPKGYGFCEYRDPKLVEVAVELLHNFEHRGAKLYVRRATQDKQSSQSHHTNNINNNNNNNNSNNDNNNSNNNNNKDNNKNNTNSNNNNNNNNNSNNKLIKKKKKQSSSKRKSVDEITRVVSSFSTSEKREILSQMKVLIEQNEKGAKDILLENPQLAQALLLIQMEFNLVKTTDIHALTKAVSNEVPQPKPQTQQTQQTQQPQSQQSSNTPQQQQQPAQQQQNATQPIKSQAQQPQVNQQNVPANNNGNNDNDVEMKNNNNNNNNNNAKPAQSKISEDKLKKLSSQQQNVLGRVMKMTPEQIAALPPDVQRQIRAVQAQLAKRQKQ